MPGIDTANFYDDQHLASRNLGPMYLPGMGGQDQGYNYYNMVQDSYGNEEFLLDAPFAAEKVTKAVWRLKKRRAPGSDAWSTG